MKPYNLVIITPDQLRADFLSCYGHPKIQTAHIDQLAEEGVLLENCYCAAPLCAPSRISFATSTYVSEHQHRNYWSTISPDVPNLVGVLKNSGYRTGMFGKNHLFTYERLPEVWDELDEICLGNYDGHPDITHAFSSFTMDSTHPFNITGRLTDEAIGFMDHHSDRPFFLWLNYQDPHPAYTCPAPYDSLFDESEIQMDRRFSEYRPETQPVRNEIWRKHSAMDDCTEADMRRAIAYYMGQIRYVDDSVGRLMDALRERSLERTTIVLFFSDHGELLGDYRMTHKLPVFYDCLTRIPVIIRHPGNYAGRRFRGLVEEVDLVPTLLDMMGIRIPETMIGQSLRPGLDCQDDSGRESILCEAGGGAPTCLAPIPGLRLLAPHVPTSFGAGAMIREGHYKLTIYGDDRCELFDLSSDPDELDNRYLDNDFQEIRNRLTLLLLKRILKAKTRQLDTLDWPAEAYPVDVRFEPLE